MAYVPMFEDLKDQLVIVVGGGKIAFRKVQKLMPYEPKVMVIAPEIIPELEDMPGISCMKRKVQEEDLEKNPAMVIAATDKQELNLAIASACRERKIPVNVVDDLENCSFVFPALVKQGAFSAGICTSGTSPTAAAYNKEKLKNILPEH